MKALTGLVREHSLLNLLWSTLERQVQLATDGKKLNLITTNDLMKALTFFALGPHMAKEEELLLPALEAAGVPRDHLQLSMLLEEHLRIRDEVAELQKTFEALYAGNTKLKRRYVRILTKAAGFVRLHIYREEYNLFPMASIVLGDEGHRELQAAFELLDRHYGLDKILEFEQIVLGVGKEYGLGLYKGKVVPVVVEELVPQGSFRVETYPMPTLASERA